MKLAIALTVALALHVSPALAQTAEEAEAALNNVQHEMSICIAFYLIVAECVRKRDAALGDQFLKIAEHMFVLSTQIGMSIGMTDDAMSSRINIERGQMQELIQKSCTNISSLSSRHALRCKQLAENGDSILKEYLNK